jgi:hypothetical protein
MSFWTDGAAVPTTGLTSPAALAKERMRIGASAGAAIEVKGGITINTAGETRPTCDAAHRGQLWFTQNSGTPDTLSVCILDVSTYNWKDVVFY